MTGTGPSIDRILLCSARSHSKLVHHHLLLGLMIIHLVIICSCRRNTSSAQIVWSKPYRSRSHWWWVGCHVACKLIGLGAPSLTFTSLYLMELNWWLPRKRLASSGRNLLSSAGFANAQVHAHQFVLWEGLARCKAWNTSENVC